MASASTSVGILSPLPDTPTAHWSFLYSLLVAAVYGILGVHPLVARLVQAVLGGILLPWMMYRFTLRLFEEPVGLSELGRKVTQEQPT